MAFNGGGSPGSAMAGSRIGPFDRLKLEPRAVGIWVGDETQRRTEDAEKNDLRRRPDALRAALRRHLSYGHGATSRLDYPVRH